MREYADTHADEFATDPREQAGPSGALLHVVITGASPMGRDAPIDFATPAVPDHRAINQIRKSGYHFDGRDPAAFLERLAEFCENYHIEEQLRGLSELLRGTPFCGTGITCWASWASWQRFEAAFRLQFLPHRYDASLRREIENRHQKANETFAQYSTVMMTLMRRAGGFSPIMQLEYLYDHMHPEYKFYIRRRDIGDISELQARAREHEDLVSERQEALKREKAEAKPAVAAVYNKAECCCRCKQRGHTRRHCRRPAKKFCSQCGRDGVLPAQCHPPAGKADGAGEKVAAVTPSPE